LCRNASIYSSEARSMRPQALPNGIWSCSDESYQIALNRGGYSSVGYIRTPVGLLLSGQRMGKASHRLDAVSFFRSPQRISIFIELALTH
jgi:hypothetical protein